SSTILIFTLSLHDALPIYRKIFLPFGENSIGGRPHVVVVAAQLRYRIPPMRIRVDRMRHAAARRLIADRRVWSRLIVRTQHDSRDHARGRTLAVLDHNVLPG